MKPSLTSRGPGEKSSCPACSTVLLSARWIGTTFSAFEDFVARARGKMIFPSVMVVANLVAFVAAVVLPWISWHLRSKGVATD